MSSQDFSFALDLSDEPYFEPMLPELATAVCVHAGLANDAATELMASLRQALSTGAANGHSRCHVVFTAHDGQLQIVVQFAGGNEWRTSRALPAGQA